MNFDINLGLYQTPGVSDIWKSEVIALISSDRKGGPGMLSSQAAGWMEPASSKFEALRTLTASLVFRNSHP